jgi:serine/threonine-protein kinase RsbW
MVPGQAAGLKNGLQLQGYLPLTLGYPRSVAVVARDDLGEDLPPALSRGYSAIADSVPLARDALVSVAAAAGAESDRLEAVRLAASEALTNAVIHAYQDRPGLIHVAAWTSPDEFVMEIADDGLGLRAGSDTPGLGVGLGLIAQLTDGFDIRQPHSGGTEVLMRFSLGPQPPN